jgi:CrcB protein
MTTDRPAHLRPELIALAFVGGAVGTAIREALALALPAASGGFPGTVFVINLVGSFVLGLLLETLALAGPDVGARRRMRILLGTGVLGGFTTYSTYTVATASLLGAHPGVALLYGLGSLVAGVAVAGVGVVVAARVRGRRDVAVPAPGDAGPDHGADS